MNSLSFLMGPPKVPPNWFQRIGDRKFCPMVQFRAQLLALSLSLRKYSNTLPWYWLVPLLITTLTMPPWKLPNSAEALLVIMLNSAMASGFGWWLDRLSVVWLL